MKAAILYKGEYGSTESYANYLSKMLEIPALSSDEVDDFAPYHQLIIGSSVYMGKLKIASYLKDNWAELKRRKLYIFIVSITEPDSVAYHEMIKKSFTPEQLECVQLYRFPGKLDIKALAFLDRLVMAFLSKATSDPKQRSIFSNGVDHVNLKEANQLISDFRQAHLRMPA